MAKWADFGIFRVRYNAERTAIAELEVRPDQGENFGETQRVARLGIVNAIEQGTTFVTVVSRDGKFHRGEDVRVIVVQGVKYIRSDRNAVRGDNLGQLPEY